VANNIVTSAVEEYHDPDTGQTKPGVWTSQSDEVAVFLAGKEYPVPAVDFNGVMADLSYMKNEAQLGNGLYFGEDTVQEDICHPVCVKWWWLWCVKYEDQCEVADYPVVGYHIILGTGDTFQLKKVIDYSNIRYNIEEESVAESHNYPDSGLLFFEKPIWVEGQINNRKITIASADLSASATGTDIYIEKDILYTNKDGSDVIGLIAENNISVGYYSEDNLEIDAALLAQKGRVGRDHYFLGSYNWRDEITVFGSIATNERYGFAWTDGTGYQTRNLYFDNNLLYYPPPYFPTGTVYELDLWEDL